MARRRIRGEGSVYFHKRLKLWVAEGRFGRRPDGKPDRRIFYGQTPQEALAKLDEAKRQHADGTLPIPNKVTVSEWAERWLRDVQHLRGTRREGLAENTVEVYRNALRYLTEAYGGMLLRDLTGRHLTDLYVRMRERDLSLRQCEIVHKVAGQMLRAAVAEKLIPRDVSKDVANPPRPVYDEPRALEPAEVQAILRAADTTRRRRWYVAFRLALDAALGRGELLGLQWKHVDLRAGTVTIEQQALRHGKYVVISELKTKARRRTNPLAPETTELLRNWRDELRRRTGLDILPADTFVFPMQHRGRIYLNRPTSPEALDAAFRACCQDAKVQDATFHCLRATAATWMAEAGVPPKTAMRRLGHASLQTTLKFYTRATDASQQDAARALARRLQEQA